MQIVTIVTDHGYTLDGIAVEGWQSYQEALDEQAHEYGIKSKQLVDKVYKDGKAIYRKGAK